MGFPFEYKHSELRISLVNIPKFNELGDRYTFIHFVHQYEDEEEFNKDKPIETHTHTPFGDLALGGKFREKLQSFLQFTDIKYIQRHLQSSFKEHSEKCSFLKDYIISHENIFTFEYIHNLLFILGHLCHDTNRIATPSELYSLASTTWSALCCHVNNLMDEHIARRNKQLYVRGNTHFMK